MAIGRISGSMLVSNLDRQGVDLQFTTNSQPLFYMNFSQYRLGINTNVATQTLTINGNLSTSGIVIDGNTISTKNGGSVNIAGVSNLGPIGNVKISGGSVGYLLLTDGAGNLSFGDPSVVVGQTINANVVALGTNAVGSFSSALTFTTATKTTDAIASLNQVLGYITDSGGTLIHVTGNITAGNVISNLYGNVVGNTAGYHTGTVTGNITGTSASFTNVSGTLLTANQPNITSVGTLISLSVTGNVAAGNVSASTISGSLSGIVLTPAQTNITSVGTLTSLLVTSNVQAGNVIATQFNGNTIGIHTGNASGASANFTSITGTLQTVAQPNITSVGTLVSLGVTGNVTAGNVNSTVYGNINTNNVSGIDGNLTITVPSNQVAIISSSTALKIPSGDDAARPLGVPGYTRFNTASTVLEFFDGVEWIPVTNKVTSQTFAGDGTNVTYSLSQSTTLAGCLISINGTMQQPSVAYSISTNSITFSEILLTTDIVDVRFLGGVTSLSGTVANDLSVQGNVTMTGIMQSPLTTKESTAPGVTGQVCHDANYIYVCTATDTWKRSPLTGGY